jgi:hypothetical protein
LHHLISLKIKDKLHIFDFASDYEWGKGKKCHINAKPDFNYDLDLSNPLALDTEEIDFKVSFLGKISDKFNGKDVLAELRTYVY